MGGGDGLFCPHVFHVLITVLRQTTSPLSLNRKRLKVAGKVEKISKHGNGKQRRGLPGWSDQLQPPDADCWI